MTESRWTPEVYQADMIPEGEFGCWKIERFTVAENAMGRVHYALQGRDVPAGTYTRLMRRQTVVMSDTPAELYDLRSFWSSVRILRGHVLLHGLGLGCAVRMALQAGAELVTVVELDRDLIAHVAPHLDLRHVAMVQGDAFTLRHPVGARWSVVWHDVWDDLCEDNLLQMTVLHRKFGGRCEWQGSWSKDYLTRRTS